MLELITYSDNLGEPSDSPFCTKVMCLLQLSGLEWKAKATGDPRKAPKNKLPVLVDGETAIADSEQIREHLETAYDVDFDAGLSDEQKAVSRMVIRAMDEHLYFAIVHDRWMVDKNWAVLSHAFFGKIPFPMNKIVPGMVRKQVKGQLMGQGMGRHSVDEQFERVKKDIDAVKVLVGKNAFLFGKNPSAADASAVAMLRGASVAPHRTRLSGYVLDNSGLMAYLDRGKAAMYPK